jgi:hypothetical protein
VMAFRTVQNISGTVCVPRIAVFRTPLEILRRNSSGGMEPLFQGDSHPNHPGMLLSAEHARGEL